MYAFIYELFISHSSHDYFHSTLQFKVLCLFQKLFCSMKNMGQRYHTCFVCLIKYVPFVAIFLLHILLLKEITLSKIEERQSNTIVVIISLHIQNKTKNGVCNLCFL